MGSDNDSQREIGFHSFLFQLVIKARINALKIRNVTPTFLKSQQLSVTCATENTQDVFAKEIY